MTETIRTDGNVEYVLVNGDFQVHKLGCADTKKLIAQHKTDYEAPVTAHFTGQTETVLDLWDDIIGDNWDQADFAKLDTPEKLRELNGLFGATHFAPCTKRILRADQPEAPAETPAKPSKREAKQDLARRVMLAVDEVIRTMDESDVAMLLGRDAAAKTVSQWLHHLPVGQVWFVQNVKHLPKPDRSDWR